VPTLIEALEDESVGYLAARVLGRIEDDRAVEPLIKALGAGDKSLRWDAARSLEMITGQEHGEDQARWEAWYARRGGR
jgi:HEAT repeat protein